VNGFPKTSADFSFFGKRNLRMSFQKYFHLIFAQRGKIEKMKPISGFVFSAPGLQFQILEKINPLQTRRLPAAFGAFEQVSTVRPGTSTRAVR
jgi:hypothetical protein